MTKEDDISNDTKYWALRIANVVMLFVDSWFLGKAIMASLQTSSTARGTIVWFVLTGVAMVLNVPLYIYYRRAKAERWQDSDAKTKEQLEVETLAAYAKQQQIEAENKKPETHN